LAYPPIWVAADNPAYIGIRAAVAEFAISTHREHDYPVKPHDSVENGKKAYTDSTQAFLPWFFN
jgi:hypothetical protein